MAFDPSAPLPGPPDPWRPSSMPAGRDAPPYLMTEMIAAEPALAERLARRLLADTAVERLANEIGALAEAGRPLVTTGCGTSEHAAMAAAGMLSDALAAAGLPADRVAPIQAFELAARLPAAGMVLAVSHEGGTAATNLALERARAAGLATALITVGGGSPAASLADHLLCTGEQDQSWCHTVGYLSPMVASTVLAPRLRNDAFDPVTLRALLDAADHAPAADEAAAVLATCRRLLVVGSGADYITARELALKVEEGARLPAVAHQLETIRHGHLAAADPSTALVLVLTDAESRGLELVELAISVLRAAAALEMPATAIHAADLGDDLPLELTPAGRAAVPITRHLPRIVCGLLGAAIPLQLLAERLARARGMNPDTLGREDSRQAAAAQA